jgi:hypothetical protein
MLLGGVLLTMVGISYGWVAMKKRECGRRMAAMQKEIGESQRQLEAIKIRLSRKLASAPLTEQLARMGSILAPIAPSQLYEVEPTDLTLGPPPP